MIARCRKLRRLWLPLALLASLAPAATQAQPAFQVKDLNTTRPNGILPEPASDYFPDSAPAAVGGTVFFAASDGIHGFELWKSDGTDAGTRMVMDICPGSCASVPRDFKTFGEVVVFVANDGLRGSELWKSDGTAAGTFLIKDLTPGEESQWIDILEVIDGQLIFSVEHFSLQEQFWRTDGTAEGTVQLPGPPERLNGVVVAGGREFFVKVAPDGKVELWTSNGTEPGAMLVKAIQAPGGSFIRGLTALGPNVLFIGPGDGYSYALWKSDGTANGTGPISSIPFSSGDLTTANNRLLFFAGCTLWTSDGTGAGTGALKNFRPDLGPNDNCPQLSPMPSSGDNILFFAYDGVQGPALWKSNGTLAGTSLIHLLNPNVSSSYSSPPSVFADGRWYFRANGDEETGEQLWTSDGTAAGTRMLRINYQRSGFVVNTRGDLLGPRALFDWNGLLLFQGGLSELWRSDGTAAGTSPVKDLRPGVYGSLPGEFTLVGDTVFFRAGAGTHRESLWKTDGTPAGTQLLHYAEYLHFFGSFGPRNLTALGGNLVFIGTESGEFASDFMKSDGTPEGTTRVVPVSASWPYPHNVQSIVSTGTRVFLQTELGEQLWKSDGTEAGTSLLSTALSPRQLLEDSSAVRDGVLFFAGKTPESGEELWRSDGTAAGTHLLTEIVPGPGSKPLGPFAVAGSTLFFVADGHEIWKNNASGTALVRSLPSAPATRIHTFTVIGQKIYFAHDDGMHGRELWVSDGTEAGTRMVEDILPGPGSSHPRQLHAQDSILLFSATDGVHGVEPWRSDGTALGTRMLQDIAPGALPSSPVQFTASGPNIYFAANDGTTGFELWALYRPTLLATFADVPVTFWAWQLIEGLAASGITQGCAPDRFCPELSVSRAETAVFLLRAIHGAAYTPPAGTGTRFTDVPASFWAMNWIERFAVEGITSGCGVNLFCPVAPVSRAELAVFLLRSKHGATYQPPAATGARFTDVPANYWAAAWIEQLAKEGITNGCAPNQFCPDRAVTRAEMAAFLVTTFGLPLPPAVP